jgi:MFS family permease
LSTGAAFTIPAAFNMIIQLFPDPAEQARAIAIFGTSGALGNIGGLLIGGVLSQLATWHWIFWVVAIITLPIAIGSVFFIPNQKLPELSEKDGVRGRRWERLDMIGVSTLIGLSSFLTLLGCVADVLFVQSLSFFSSSLLRKDQTKGGEPLELSLL